MLAQNLKTAADLSVTADQYTALLTVLRMLEREEIPAGEFNMGTITHPCGTPACMLGWANHVAPGSFFPPGALSVKIGGWSYNLRDLFAIGPYELPQRQATRSQAAIALRSYLTTGEPSWAEALA